MANKLKQTLTQGNNTVKLYWNAEYQEYTCKLYQNGVAYAPADYYTGDLQDAQDTAKFMVNREWAV